MRYIKKIIIGLLIVFLFLAAIFLVKSDKEKKNEESQAITEKEQKLKPLEEELEELEKQLAENEEEYYAKTAGVPHMILYFEDASSVLYEKVFPLLQEYDYPAVFALEDIDLIGTEGYLTRQQYEELRKAGWQGIDERELKRYQEHFRLEEIRMREEKSNVRIELEKAKEEDTSKMITVRYLGEQVEDPALDCSTGKYRKMLQWMKEQGEEVRVDTLYNYAVYKNEIVGHLDEYRNAMEETRQKLEEKIEEINTKILNVDKNGSK